ncbi:MAG: sigma-54-dependent Fis family transcriptional regulator [Methylothermaceae bacterium]|nr:sigma-54-dependent Fis family transcriptional regulator [Methylothermaceae bacterium]
MRNSLLIIEDEILLGKELAHHYRKLGWEVWLTRNLREARQLLDDQQLEPLVVLSDMNLPDGNALDFFEELGGHHAGCEWIFLTGYGTVADSVRALRLGTYDFLEKPCDPSRLQLLLESAARSAHAQRRLAFEAAQGNARYTPAVFAGVSPRTVKLRQLPERLAQLPFSSLVIQGETGTGKGLAARVLHHSGLRRQGPWVELNCAALPRELVESELFGYEPGAFTGAKNRHHGLLEQADGGTLFLDEIGELDPGIQAKLLKAVEDKRFRLLGGERDIQVDVQIIAASNRDLAKEVETGHFRGDLYHRLTVFQVEIPPLRERKEDLQILVPMLVEEFNAKAGKRVREIPEAAWSAFERYHWPGNVRELRNLIERCVLLAEDEMFPHQWLGLPGTTPPLDDDSTVRLPLDGSLSLDEMERRIIQSALTQTSGNITAAARLLKTTRETLRYRIQKYHLEHVVK